MKCKYCGSAWQSKVEVKICPFCGKSLAEPDSFEDIELALAFIMDTYGEQVSKNPNCIVAFLGDLAPKLTNERRLLKMCADAGIIVELLSITGQVERNLAARRAVAVLRGTYFLDAKWAETAVGWLTVSMGWTNSAGEVQPAEEWWSETVPALQQKKPHIITGRFGADVELILSKEENAQRERIRKRRKELKKYAGRIACGRGHILALRSDGTVVAYGDNDNGQCNVEDWRDVTAIACDADDLYSLSFGLTADGSVLCSDTDLYNHDQWEDVVQIAVQWNSPVVLCANGTVICSKISPCYLCSQHKWVSSDWRNVTAITGGRGTNYGLLADGTVVACGNNAYGQCDVREWKDIVSIVAGEEAIYALRKDGRVYARGNNRYGQCDVERWQDIIDITPGHNGVFGLKSDGRVVYTGFWKKKLQDVDYWTDIVAVVCPLSEAAVVGLKADGHVKICGFDRGHYCDTMSWRDIVAIACGDGYVVGLQADGTVVCTGWGACDEEKIAGQNLLH